MTSPAPIRPERSAAADSGAEYPAPAGKTASADARSLTLSQERLHAGTELASAGSVRLEKYLVTETRTIEVQVTRERVRLVFTGPDGTQDVTEDPPATFHPSPLAVDTTRWLFLHEEQPVVSKQWVPVERIRLDKYWIAGEEEVTEDVRAEQVELTTDPTTEKGDTTS